jgi:tRNA G10  N-methylase Trm11
MKSGIRVDVRPEMNPTYVADCRNVPLPDASVDWIMSDPPYSEEYARNLYGTEKHYPLPGQILKEACRLLKPGGRVGLLHFQVPMSRKPLCLVSVTGITTGAGYAIRAWSVFEKEAA